MRALATRDVLSAARNSYYRDVVVVAAQEVLRARNDVPEHDRGAEGVQNVLVVRVQDQTLRHSACTHTSPMVNKMSVVVATCVTLSSPCLAPTARQAKCESPPVSVIAYLGIQ